MNTVSMLLHYTLTQFSMPLYSLSHWWSFPFRLTNQNSLYISHLSHACYVPAHLTLSLSREEYKL